LRVIAPPYHYITFISQYFGQLITMNSFQRSLLLCSLLVSSGDAFTGGLLESSRGIGSGTGWVRQRTAPPGPAGKILPRCATSRCSAFFNRGGDTVGTAADQPNDDNSSASGKRAKIELIRHNSPMDVLKNVPQVMEITRIQPKEDEIVAASGNNINADESNEYLADFLQEKKSSVDGKAVLAGGAALAVALALGAAQAVGFHPADAVASAQTLIHHPQEALQGVVDQVESMGPLAPLYFGLIYCLAEVLAVPATPLTLSAGYLFGLGEGTAVVLAAATIAASIAFFVGKTFLRTWVEEIIQEQPKFQKLDKAIGREGFKLLLLVRLSPIFPFALSNYLYGASSVKFPAYFWGTLLGFIPGSLAYVYTGMVGKELALGGFDGSQPWYVYAGGFAVLAAFFKIVTDVASGIIDELDDDDGTPSSPTSPSSSRASVPSSYM